MDPYHSQRGMIMPFVLAILLVGAAILGARYAAHPAPSESPSPTPEPSVSVSASPVSMASPSGSPGPNTLVTEFSMAGYLNAVKTGKLAVLYFYANWSDDSKAAFPKFQASVAALADPKVAAFRVNYNDSDTDSEEATAAKTFQVGSQQTVVVVKDGKQAAKSDALIDYGALIAEHLR